MQAPSMWQWHSLTRRCTLFRRERMLYDSASPPALMQGLLAWGSTDCAAQCAKPLS